MFALLNIETLDSAEPYVPITIAPACPILFSFGAALPAMYATVGFLNPMSYMLPYDKTYGLASQAGIRINDTSLTLGTYEQFKEASFDPYIAVRDAYKQYRDSKIKDTTKMKGSVTYTEEGVCLPLE